MKKIYLLFVAAFLMLYSCSLLEDANTVSVDSTLTMDIPISISDFNAISLKSTASYDFNESGGASLEDDEELKDYLNKIKSISIEGATVYFYGLQSGQVVKTVNLTVDGVGVVASLTDVSNANTVHNLSIDDSKLEQVANNLEKSRSISATVSGTTNEAPMYFSISTEFDIKVKAEAL